MAVASLPEPRAAAAGVVDAAAANTLPPKLTAVGAFGAGVAVDVGPKLRAAVDAGAAGVGVAGTGAVPPKANAAVVASLVGPSAAGVVAVPPGETSDADAGAVEPNVSVCLPPMPKAVDAGAVEVVDIPSKLNTAAGAADGTVAIDWMSLELPKDGATGVAVDSCASSRLITALVAAGAAAGAVGAIGLMPTVAGAGTVALLTPKLKVGVVLAVALTGAAALKFPNTGGIAAAVVPPGPKLNP